MHRIIILSALLVLLLAVCTRAQQTSTKAFDTIEQAYAPYMDPADPLAFPMKVQALASDPYKFWRGSKDLFFRWAIAHCNDWLGDTSAYQPTHGDLHVGNIGSYASEEGWGKLAFGMVDFDDSARLPFQFELLQGLITLELMAENAGIELSAEHRAQMDKQLIEVYRTVVNSRRNATELLKDDPIVSKFLKSKADYSKTLDGYVKDGKFTPIILTGKGRLKEVLRPAMDRVDELAAGIAQAIENSPEMKRLFRHHSKSEIRAAIKDAVLRTRIGSSGSQGLRKYFVLLANPLKDQDTDIILYLKEQIPAAAERSGAIPRDSRSPGRRVKEDMDHLTDPRAYLNSWCDIGTGPSAQSYWVTFKEPWSDELDPDKVKNFDDLLAHARIWATVAAATHREEGRFNTILPRLTPELTQQVRQRTDAYLAQLKQEFAEFVQDPRTEQHLQKVDAAIGRLMR